MSKREWIGVDLDGTLAEYGEWKGPYHVGNPIPRMVERVKMWLAEGRLVKIFTARMDGKPEYTGIVRDVIEKWCLEHIGQTLEITNVKDYAMIELWDDRAVQVIPNTGERADGRLQ